jgi:hypothetical protein
MNFQKKPDVPAELWGLWMPVPSRGKPRWVGHMHGDLSGRGGPMVFFTQEEAEQQAEGEDLDCWEVYVPVRMLCTSEAGTPVV